MAKTRRTNGHPALRAMAFTALLLASASGCDRKERHAGASPMETGAPSVVPSGSPLPAPSAPSAPPPDVTSAPDATDVTAVPPGRRARVRQMFVTNELGETTCSMTDFGETFRGGLVITDREIYSFPKLNARLRKYPGLAAAVGLSEVKDCNDARRYAERYHEYSQAHPGFDHEGPTKEEQFREFLSDPANIARPGSSR